MRTEEVLLQQFVKENSLTGLDFSWGTNKDRYYVAFNLEGKEVHIHYNVDSEKITSRLN